MGAPAAHCGRGRDILFVGVGVGGMVGIEVRELGELSLEM